MEYNGYTGYVEKKGRGKDDQSIDRPDNDAGYTMGNMQPLTVSENSQKGACPL